MSFFIVKKRFGIINKNTFLLVHDDWNDYWKYKTLYRVYYFDKQGKDIYLGEIKIGNTRLDEDSVCSYCLPDSFDELDDTFFSVGQSQDYYSNVYEYLDDLPANPFVNLKDMAYNLDILKKNIDRDVTKVSLLRSISITQIKGQFNRIAQGGVKLTPYEFTFSFPKNYSDSSLGKNNLKVQVTVGSLPSSNIHILIGRNGVGKSMLFNNIVKLYLSKENNDDEFVDEYGEVIEPHTIFPNLIYMGYSVFDNNTNIEDFGDEWDEKRYIYLGLRKYKDTHDSEQIDNIYTTKDLDDLSIEFANSVQKCISSKYKKDKLEQSLKILESDPIFKQANISTLVKSQNNEGDKEKLRKLYMTNLSSGHGIVLLTLVKLVETVEEKTLVLLDEPETHLHPPLLSSFIRCLSELLISRNAVAIIATHSPVILQEVPKECVWKLDRAGRITQISRPRYETFGESYTKIVEDVFGLELQDSGFHKLITEEVNKSSSYEEFIAKFNNQLGSDADIIARTLFAQKEKADNEN